MYNAIQETVDSYRVAPDIYRALLAGCTQEQAQAARGGDEDWSVVEVMCHMRDAEEVALNRMRAMRDQDNPSIAGYDQEGWAVARNYAASDLREALDAFVALRAQHVSELEALAKEDWDRTGEHSEYGSITIMSHALHMANHDVAHAAQLARQLSQ